MCPVRMCGGHQRTHCKPLPCALWAVGIVGPCVLGAMAPASLPGALGVGVQRGARPLLAALPVPAPNICAAFWQQNSRTHCGGRRVRSQDSGWRAPGCRASPLPGPLRRGPGARGPHAWGCRVFLITPPKRQGRPGVVPMATVSPRDAGKRAFSLISRKSPAPQPFGDGSGAVPRPWPWLSYDRLCALPAAGSGCLSQP